jgi:hypothetical protein
VDQEGDFPYGRVANFAKANGRAQAFAALAAATERRVHVRVPAIGCKQRWVFYDETGEPDKSGRGSG